MQPKSSDFVYKIETVSLWLLDSLFVTLRGLESVINSYRFLSMTCSILVQRKKSRKQATKIYL